MRLRVAGSREGFRAGKEAGCSPGARDRWWDAAQAGLAAGRKKIHANKIKTAESHIAIVNLEPNPSVQLTGGSLVHIKPS